MRIRNETRPRFEYYPVSGSALQTVEVEKFPFVIGRGETTQLQIKSNSISREHARLLKTPTGFRLRDLKSTNGTAINGQPITDAPLEDGDTVSIAETELTFICSANSAMERMATQPLADKRKADPKIAQSSALLASRALSEVLLWQAIPLCRTSIVETQAGFEQATVVSIDKPLATHLQASDAYDACSTASRIQQLAWQLTAEHAEDITTAGSILMRVELRSGLDDRLCDALDQALECLKSEQLLGVILPWEWAVQSPDTLTLCSELRALGAILAFDEFSGGAACIDDMKLVPPDLMVLAPAQVRGISSHPRRMKQLQNVVANCSAADIRVVLPAGMADEDKAAGSEMDLNLILNGQSVSRKSCNSKPLIAAV